MIVKLFRPLVIIAAVAGAASTSQLANATVFDWSYTNGAPPAGGGITASGMLDATPDGGGVYTVTSITGNRNGVTITGLATYAEDDNLVYADAADLYGVGAHVDYPGLAYSVAGGSVFNIYYDTSTLDAYACGAVGYCEI